MCASQKVRTLPETVCFVLGAWEPTILNKGKINLFSIVPSKPTKQNIHNPSDIIRYSVGSPFFLLSKLCEIEIFGLLKLRILSAPENRGAVGIRSNHFLQATKTLFQLRRESMPIKVQECPNQLLNSSVGPEPQNSERVQVCIFSS